jgi:hypothetical protein
MSASNRIERIRSAMDDLPELDAPLTISSRTSSIVPDWVSTAPFRSDQSADRPLRANHDRRPATQRDRLTDSPHDRRAGRAEWFDPNVHSANTLNARDRRFVQGGQNV